MAEGPGGNWRDRANNIEIRCNSFLEADLKTKNGQMNRREIYYTRIMQFSNEDGEFYRTDHDYHYKGWKCKSNDACPYMGS